MFMIDMHSKFYEAWLIQLGKDMLVSTIFIFIGAENLNVCQISAEAKIET